jgi:hypothetical protein
MLTEQAGFLAPADIMPSRATTELTIASGARSVKRSAVAESGPRPSART